MVKNELEKLQQHYSEIQKHQNEQADKNSLIQSKVEEVDASVKELFGKL